MAPAPESPHVRTIRELIERRFDQPFSLRRVAAAIGRDASYLSGLFRRQVGCGVRAYLVKVRMEQAGALLDEGTKVEAVVAAVGYRSKKNFYRQFKGHFGMTPALFRARKRAQPR